LIQNSGGIDGREFVKRVQKQLSENVMKIEEDGRRILR
jgi:hypothetical protein